MNLQEITKEIAVKHVAIVDQALSDYVLGAIRLLETQGKDITEYTLIKVDNPMELKENSVRITGQWRITKIADIQNAPIYGED